MLDGLAMASNIIVAPHFLELRAEPAKFIDKRFHLLRRPCTRRVQDGEAYRDGRWAGLEKDECGIHTGVDGEGI